MQVAVLLGCCLVFSVAQVGAQSVLLDANLKFGYQGANVVRALASGDEVSVEIIGKGISGADGFSLVLNYDADLLSFTSYKVGAAIPGLTGLQLPGSSGVIEVGGASLSGVAGEGSLRIGIVTFTVTGSISTSSITIGSTVITVSGTESAVTQTEGISLQTSADPISLDADADAGQQGATVVDGVTAGETVLVELIGSGLDDVSGYAATLTYSGGLVYDGFTASSLIPGFSGLQLTGSGQVEIGGASVSGTATASDGRLGVARFIVGPAFGGEATITLAGGTFAGQLGEQTLDLAGAVTVLGSAAAKNSDFDGDGVVGFSDFLTFAGAFGKTVSTDASAAPFDLDDDGSVGFLDFLVFAADFGKTIGAGKPAIPATTTGATGQLTTTVVGTRLHATLSLTGDDYIAGVGTILKYDSGALEFVEALRPDRSPLADNSPLLLHSDLGSGRLALSDASTTERSVLGSGAFVTAVFDIIPGPAPQVEIADLLIFDESRSVRRARDVDVMTAETILRQNAPNPFNPQTQISYQIARESRVTLTVYSETGQEVIRLVNEKQSAGNYQVVWDGRDGAGRKAASGLYLYQLETDDSVVTKRMALIK